MASLQEMLNDPDTQLHEEPMEVSIPLPAPFENPRPVAPVEAPAADKYRNIEMEQMLAVLEKYLERTDKIGYAAARNTRILRAETQEYFDRREKLIERYGEPQIGEDGNPTGMTELRFDSPKFAEYARDIEEWALIEHSPAIFKIPAEEAIGELSGTEILEIDWMLKW